MHCFITFASSSSQHIKNCPFIHKYILQLQTLKAIQGRNDDILQENGHINDYARMFAGLV